MMDEYLTLDDIVEVAESLGWYVTVESDFVEFENWTNYTGQDLIIDTDSTDPYEVIEYVVDFARNYNVNNEVKLLAEFRGQRGIPASIRDIREDCKEAKGLYAELSDELYKLTV